MKPRFVVVSLYLSACIAAVSAGVASAQPRRPQGPLPGRQQVPPRQEPVRSEETVVVTADRELVDVKDVGSSVSVLTREEIAASGARWLVDVLQFAPGVNASRGGPPGSLTDVYIRGASSSHTLFLIDGVKLNSPTTGSYDLAGMQIAADQIERIEIVRGPQSTLYGSQAIGGVINVITRQGAGPGTWGVEAEGGAYGTGRFNTWANGEARSVRYSGGVSYFDSEGFSSASEANGNTEPDGYRNVSYNGRVDYEADNGLLLRGFVRGFDGDFEFDDFDFLAGPIDGPNNVQTTRELYAAATAAFRGAEFSSQVQVSATDANNESNTPDGFFTGFGLDSAIYEVDWQNEVALPGGHGLTGGVEYRREQATSTSDSILGSSGFDESVDVVGVYVQDRLAVGDRAQLVGGLRYEDHSTFGSKWTGRVTATVDASDSVRVHGSAGTGFKAPTLNDLFFPGFSNPDLQPEESVGVDAGVEASLFGRGVMDVTFFYNDISELILFDFVAGIPENLGNVTTKGVEIAGDWRVGPGLTVSGNYTLTNAEPDDIDEQLIRRPRHQGGLRATTTPFSRLRVWGELRFKGGRFDSATTGRVQLDAYGIVNLAADYRLSSLLLLRGRIDNLFDTEYEEIVGFGTAGIGAYVGLTFTLAR